MKLGKLIEKLNIISSSADEGIEISGICYDSRTAEPGNIFVAVRGFESDGHRFIPNAVKAGASVVICEELSEDPGVPCIVVENARYALAMISCAFYDYPSEKMQVIGITGTSGKTTSTNLVKHILETAAGAKVGLIGTNGNMIGDKLLHTEHTTPESLELQKLFAEMLEEGCTHVVMEVSSHALSLDRVAGIRYTAAAFTNLSQDHLDFHGTMDAYAEAKSILFGMCDAACINIDDPYAGVMLSAAGKSECKVISSSIENKEAVLSAENLSLSSSGVCFSAEAYGQKTEIRLAIPGKFSVYNALTAVSVCLACGVSLKQCAEALATAKGVKGRVENVPVDGDYTVLIDYSHKPDALENVLRTLRPVTKGRLIVLFGCGGDRDRKKRPIMGKVAVDNADVAIVTSDNPRTEEPEAIISEILEGIKEPSGVVKVIVDRIEAIHWAIDNAAPGDVVLLAGKGHEDYQVIGHEKIHMDEREIVYDYLKEKSNL
ncbi:MAG: UDP-N-acetylmuramoyl-L-alanyl-D-glutamate--2,6-diaminopimelate ligase [Eubacteriales bacterium]|nr:UDP-N-acetylmuramoyl-L-alanyl-D-glutamate--2,6-diaminopimelate ligase [Eubacteriales bacterium]